jgi:hypothetical protein
MKDYLVIISLFLLGIFLSILMVQAQLETYPVTKEVDLKFICTLNNAIPSALTQYNITISYPNGTTFINNKGATAQGSGAFNYTTNFPIIGNYKVQMFCYDSTYSFADLGYYEVTGNGKENATGGIVVLFIIVFLVLIGLTFYLVLYSIGHLVNADFDIIDLAYDWGLFFMILALYFLENFYLGNQAIETYLLWFIGAGGILLVLLPLIAFILSIVNGSFSKQGYSFRVPKRRFQ